MKKYLLAFLGLFFLAGAALAQSPVSPGGGPTPADEPAEAPLPPDKAADYVGVYAIGEQAHFTILLDAAGRLQSRLTGQRFIPIFYTGGDQFTVRAVHADLVFTRSRKGKVSSVMITQGDHQLTGQRTDDPVPTVLFLPPAKLQEYVGRYPIKSGRMAGADCLISIRNGWPYAQITAVLRRGGAAAQKPTALFADRPDHFVLDVAPVALSFDRDHAGVVNALTLHQDGRDNHLIKAAPAAP